MIPPCHLALHTGGMLPQECPQIVFFLASNQCNTASSTRYSLWAVAQSVTCISTRTHPAVTCTSFSRLWSPSTMAGSYPLALWVALKTTPSRTDHRAFVLRQVVIWLSTSATVLSRPFWYSNWKSNFARAPTHWWLVASKLGVVIIYVKGLLSVLTRKGWYNKYSLKFSKMAYFNARNSSFVE